MQNQGQVQRSDKDETIFLGQCQTKQTINCFTSLISIFYSYYSIFSKDTPTKDYKIIFLKIRIGDKIKKVWEDSLDSISSASPSVKIQITDGKVYLR